MDTSFDLGAQEKNHKSRPAQFVSGAQGVQKRFHANLNKRRSSRFSTFDSARNLPSGEHRTGESSKCSPGKVSEMQKKCQHRKQQLEKWKLEKEQKKKELAAHKKKPFLVGIAKQPLQYVTLPPPQPSTSGRGTCSQSQNQAKPANKKNEKLTKTLESFAPDNATFKPPAFKNMGPIPDLKVPPKTKSKQISAIVNNFQPISPTPKLTRKALVHQNAVDVTETDSKPSQTQSIASSRRKVTKAAPPTKITKKIVQSSSSGSDIEPNIVVNRVKTKSATKSTRKVKHTTPRRVLHFSSEDSSSSEKNTVKVRSVRKSFNHIAASTSSSDKLSSDIEPSDDHSPMILGRKSPPKSLEMDTGISERYSSDVVFHIDTVQATPKNKVPRNESGSEEKLRSLKSQIKLALTPKQMESAKISPKVTMSRGKENERNEMKWKLREGLLDEDASDIEDVDHFRKILGDKTSSEIKRMTEKCEIGDRTLSQNVLPESVQSLTPFAMLRASLLAKDMECDGVAPLPRTPELNPVTLFTTPGKSILKSTNEIVIFNDYDSEAATFTKEPSDEVKSVNEVNVLEENLVTTDVKTRPVRKSLKNISNLEGQEDVTPIPRKLLRKKNETESEKATDSTKKIRKKSLPVVEVETSETKRSIRTRRSKV